MAASASNAIPKRLESRDIIAGLANSSAYQVDPGGPVAFMRNNTRQTRRNYGAPLASVWRGIRKAGHGAPASHICQAAAIGAVFGFEREVGPHSIVKIMALRDRRRKEGDHHDRSGCDGASPSLWLEGEGADLLLRLLLAVMK
jgi:hypothetical protein